MTAKTEKALKKLITISRKLKAQGHDLFVTYSPHVEKVEWRLFIGGWDDDKEVTAKEEYYSHDRIGKEKKSIDTLYSVLAKHKVKVGK